MQIDKIRKTGFAKSQPNLPIKFQKREQDFNYKLLPGPPVAKALVHATGPFILI